MERAAKIFNGVKTIQSPNGEHRTLDISTQKEDANFAPGKRIISLLVGPNNNADYKGFGFVTDDGIRVWQKLRSTDGKPSTYEWLGHMLWSLATEGDASRFYRMGYRLLEENTCIKCNRRLSTPESILRGIGPVCAVGGRD